jgi:hypothetical protein
MPLAQKSGRLSAPPPRRTACPCDSPAAAAASVAPASSVSSTSTVPSFGPSNGPPGGPVRAPIRRRSPRDRAPLQRRSRRESSFLARPRPMIDPPNGRRASRCAARLPRTGEPSSTMRPGGNPGLRDPAAPPSSNSFKITRPPRLWPTRCRCRLVSPEVSRQRRALSVASACSPRIGKRPRLGAESPRQAPPQQQDRLAPRATARARRRRRCHALAALATQLLDDGAVGARGHRRDGLVGRQPSDIARAPSGSRSPAPARQFQRKRMFEVARDARAHTSCRRRQMSYTWVHCRLRSNPCVMPVSSTTSRRAASSGISPHSRLPVTDCQNPAAAPLQQQEFAARGVDHDQHRFRAPKRGVANA